MRLFIAINFSDTVKSKLADWQDRLKRCGAQGNFSRKENLHLTLVFFGEVAENKIGKIKAVMDSAEAEPFTVHIGGLGTFRRDGGDIVWAGVEKSEQLFDLYNQLFDGLKSAGFTLEDRAFKPHLTLAREVKGMKGKEKDQLLKSGFQVSFPVAKIDLMKSERIAGKLTYTSIYKRVIE